MQSLPQTAKISLVQQQYPPTTGLVQQQYPLIATSEAPLILLQNPPGGAAASKPSMRQQEHLGARSLQAPEGSEKENIETRIKWLIIIDFLYVNIAITAIISFILWISTNPSPKQPNLGIYRIIKFNSVKVYPIQGFSLLMIVIFVMTLLPSVLWICNLDKFDFYIKYLYVQYALGASCVILPQLLFFGYCVLVFLEKKERVNNGNKEHRDNGASDDVAVENLESSRDENEKEAPQSNNLVGTTISSSHIPMLVPSIRGSFLQALPDPQPRGDPPVPLRVKRNLGALKLVIFAWAILGCITPSLSLLIIAFSTSAVFQKRGIAVFAKVVVYSLFWLGQSFFSVYLFFRLNGRLRKNGDKALGFVKRGEQGGSVDKRRERGEVPIDLGASRQAETLIFTSRTAEVYSRMYSPDPNPPGPFERGSILFLPFSSISSGTG